MRKRLLIKLNIAALAAAAAILAFGAKTVKAETKTAKELKLTLSTNADASRSNLLDGKYKTISAFSKNDTLTIKSTEEMTRLYIVWDRCPGEWTLESNGKTYTCGKNNYIHEYIELDEPAKECRMRFKSYQVLSDIYAYSEGELPKKVQTWQPPLDNADMLVFSAHADDEALFLSGPIVTYGGTGKCSVQVVYMCQFFSRNPDDFKGERIREHEKLDGLWEMGVTNYPVNGSFPDTYTTELSEAQRKYDHKKLTDFFTEMIRRFKPMIVVTQDFKGEYGHGGHIVLAAAVKDAVDNSYKTDYFPETVKKYGIWSVPKTYFHLYEENAIRLNLREPLDNFNNRTALQVAADAYKKHVSQQWCWFYVSDGTEKNPDPDHPDYKYSCADFGLYRTTVGYDTNNDMLENISTYGQKNVSMTNRKICAMRSVKCMAPEASNITGFRAMTDSISCLD